MFISMKIVVLILFFYFSNCFLKNVDADAAKQLMAYLVKLQSNLSEVNGYVYSDIFKTISFVSAVIRSHVFTSITTFDLMMPIWSNCFDIFF